MKKPIQPDRPIWPQLPDLPINVSRRPGETATTADGPERMPLADAAPVEAVTAPVPVHRDGI